MKKPFIIGLAVFFVALGAGYMALMSWLNGPTVQGKTVVKWTEDLASRDEAVRKNSKDTMQQKAGEFIPHLITLLKSEDSAEKQKWSTVFKVDYLPSYAGRLSATRAFAAIGASGAPAIPQLLGLLDDKVIGSDAAASLASIGKDAVQPLISKIGSGNGHGKAMALCALARMKGDMAAPALDVLIKSAKESDPAVQEWSAKAIGNLVMKPDECIPLMIALLESKDNSVVAAALASLGNYGSAAKEALPKVKALTNSRADDVKGAALSAVTKISGVAPKDE